MNKHVGYTLCPYSIIAICNLNVALLASVITNLLHAMKSSSSVVVVVVSLL